ncbi:LRR receptor-like serine/threonine-protein kinase GSO1 [Vigna radiata var. radiata]|uniref:LRR receptor-like serine/threonine-protein kinase GSO1 n=1 Tax=Vigna radiata var. radiata TaxID=3916 RepID=A0A1S3TDL3_VIGRR|nr:LRR receptor-like serine/threonine-protein kinase GSO1 [Vigna radiata var. radiata]
MNTFSSQNAIIFTWLLWGIMFNTGLGSFDTRCNQQDMHALLNFKQGLTDPSGVLSSWTTQLDCCHWKGVICSNITNRVTGISLPCSTTPPIYSDKEDKSHCLTGFIHLSSLLVELEFLEYLNLRNNDFLALQFDYLHNHNCHNLSIPTSSHCQCVNSSTLRHLDLSRNWNLAINNLKWLSHISLLEYLNLRDIDLSKESNWLQLVTMLPSLSFLNMRACQLKDLSLSFQYANFTALQVLSLSANEFNSELPKWLFNLSSTIHSLYLSSCSLIGHLPKDLLNLRELEDLFMEDNNFDGPIPDWLGHFKHLKTLNLGVNMFSGSIPTNLGNLSTLISLDVASNPLTGVVSERNLAKLSKLKSLCISSYSTLIFDFDSDWIPPFQLVELVLGFSNPNLPAWLYTQRSLERLTIWESSFEAPDKFWNLVSSVIELQLQDNSIDGDMSNVLLNSTFIDISSNGLKGCLPRLSQNVVFVLLSNNSLSGELSPLLCGHNVSNGKNKLLYLDISLNNLCGGLTNCWKNWKSLVAIHLGSNNISGKIPPSLGFLFNLTSLHLHENKLHGEIPLSLQNCRSLLVFNVRNNQLSGNIPYWISHGVLALQLRSNHFTGKISPQICQMSSLIVLDIAQNAISDHIPNCLGNIKTLLFNNVSRNKLSFKFPSSSGRYLFNDESLELATKGQVLEYGKNLHFMTLIDMSSNNLSGTIPSQMFSLIGLSSLNLSNNKLEGKIPNEIGNMKNLESLDFSTNQLGGEIPESLSRLSFLGYLNLSFNNLTGKIPSGTQLQGFTALSYMGNHDLCGPPLTKIWFQDNKHKDTEVGEEDGNQSEFLPWFYIGMESGFVIGFLGVCCAIFLNKKFRHVFFKFLYDLRYNHVVWSST